MKRKYKVHVISGTHWDREWRFTAEQSKLRLADLVDNLINLMEKKPEYKYFLLDGGTVILEDYQSIRPQNIQRLKKLIKAGRIQLVNWYTLPDMFIVAPEATVRNILLGIKVAQPYGGTMKFGYTSTSYGQTSQLPQIYRGFGIETAMFYRGTNRFMPPCFIWEGADGSRLLTFRCFDIVTRTNWFFYIHQPVVLGKPPKDLSYTFRPEELPVHSADEQSYQLDFRLLREEISFNKNSRVLKQAYKYFMDVTRTEAIGHHLLGLNMEDNQKPFALLPEMIKALNSIQNESQFVQDNLDNYCEEIKDTVNLEKLTVIKGELRRTAVEVGFNALLGAVLSSRVNLKLLNERAETQLIFLAEPLASIASFLGKEYPYIVLEKAWKSLLQNHAHDSICGAAVDRVHKDMLYRFSETQLVSEEVAQRSLEHIYQQINFATTPQAELTLTFFNSLPYPRNEVVPVIFDLPLYKNLEYFDILDINGAPVHSEIVWSEKIDMRCERELDSNAITFPAKRHYLLVPVSVPSLGCTSYVVRLRGRRYVPQPEPLGERGLIATPDGRLENEHLRVKINSNGTFDITHKFSGKNFTGLHYFTDSGEAGYAHITRKPIRDFTVTSLGSSAQITMLESSSLRGVFKVELELPVPADASFDGRDRSAHNVPLKISYCISLTKGSKRLELITRVTNTARDHRLRVNFPTDITTDVSYAESAFAVEQRSLIWEDTGDNFEPYFQYKPMQNFVAVSDGKIGLAFLNQGIREYEVIDDKRRTLAITLLRTQRSYMTANEKMTPAELEQHAGSHIPGMLEFRYALYPFSGNWQTAEVLNEAYSFKVPVKILQGVRKEEGKLPPQHSFIEIEPADKIHFSALKYAENGKGIVLRLWNSTADNVDATIKFNIPVRAVQKVNLNETQPQNLPLRNKIINLAVRPAEIITLFLSF
ncbi:MAG: glycosyl hydrolase-related protein [Candidatus Sumerlaeia bacterium]|nr:glycosyl hydrolase-related protein [Candidatus Sumerlaeia bacterium]